MNQGHYKVSSPYLIHTFQNYFPENLQLLSGASGHMVSDLFQITFNRCLARELARHNPLPQNPLYYRNKCQLGCILLFTTPLPKKASEGEGKYWWNTVAHF